MVSRKETFPWRNLFLTARKQGKKTSRRAVTLMFSVVMLLVLMGMIAFALDVGYMVLVRTQLQVAADSAAMAAAANMGRPYNEMVDEAKKFAAFHQAGSEHVQLKSSDIEMGIWDANHRRFTPTNTMGNAVRVTARRDASTGGDVSLFFGRLLKGASFSPSASAVAMANPRDIAFVVDLSGSMNDDTEPCWATAAINKEFAPEGYPTIGNGLAAKLYEDLGFGSFPGTMEYVGAPAGVEQNKYAYAELTKDNGPLTKKNIPKRYRIRSRDDEATRKVKAYSAIMDYQLRRLMPAAKPTPESSSSASYAYWEKYLDYVIRPQKIVPPSPPKPKPPAPPSPPSPPSPPTPPSPPSPPPPPKPPIGYLWPGQNAPGYAAWHESPLGGEMGRAVPMSLAMISGNLGGFLLPQTVTAAKGNSTRWSIVSGSRGKGNNRGNNKGNNRGKDRDHWNDRGNGNNKGNGNGGGNGNGKGGEGSSSSS